MSAAILVESMLGAHNHIAPVRVHPQREADAGLVRVLQYPRFGRGRGHLANLQVLVDDNGFAIPGVLNYLGALVQIVVNSEWCSHENIPS